MTNTETLRKVIQERHQMWCTFIRQETVHDDGIDETSDVR